MSTETAETILITGLWNIDPAHSSVGFEVKHMMIAKVHGKFTDFAGSLNVDEAGRLQIAGVIQAASIDTGTADRDNHLRSEDFLNAEKNPQLTFYSTEIKRTNDDEFEMTGDLTINDLTKSVELELKIKGTGIDPWENQRVALEVQGAINRRDFGLNWNQALEAGKFLVGDKVKIWVHASAIKAT